MIRFFSNQIIVCGLLLVMCTNVLSARKPEKKPEPINFKNLAAQYKNQTFRIQITSGANEESPGSGKTFAYVEAILFRGVKALHRKEFQILYHTDVPLQFQLISDQEKTYIINFRSIRPKLKPIYEKIYRSGMRNLPKHARLWIADNKDRPVIYAEYGLQKGRVYYARFHLESYKLPPEGDDKKPRQKTNQVLIISDKPIQHGKGKLTPLFQSWSY